LHSKYDEHYAGCTSQLAAALPDTLPLTHMLLELLLLLLLQLQGHCGSS
jgi:hypothetical protein